MRGFPSRDSMRQFSYTGPSVQKLLIRRCRLSSSCAAAKSGVSSMHLFAHQGSSRLLWSPRNLRCLGNEVFSEGQLTFTCPWQLVSSRKAALWDQCYAHKAIGYQSTQLAVLSRTCSLVLNRLPGCRAAGGCQVCMPSCASSSSSHSCTCRVICHDIHCQGNLGA
jgi:hypothetical protein